MPDWNWQKIKQKLSDTLRLSFCDLKIICFFHLRYPPKIIGDILKTVQNQVHLFWWGYIINGDGSETENEKSITKIQH